MKSKYKAPALATAMVLLSSLIFAVTSTAPSNAGNWCAGVSISYFKGGNSDSFSDILEKGARQAAADTGAKVTIIQSNWDFELMSQQFKEEIAKKPDAISFMGHSGDAAILTSAKAARKAGILVDFSNVPAPKSMAELNSGFVGANLTRMGNLLAARSIKDFKLKKGDQALVMGGFGIPGRSDREDATVRTLEKAGLKVIKLDLKALGDIAGNPSLLTPTFVATLKKYPKLKYINAAGPQLGAMKIYFDAAKIKPGQIKVSGFDLGPTVMQAFADGYVQLSADQEPFKQGYLPILSLCMAKVYGLSPSSVDTSSGFVTVDNYKTVAALPAGFR